MTTNKIKFIVTGAKWFDKVNGNTYHNAKIVNGETGETHYTGFQYGYDRAYLESAKNYIKDTLKINDFEIINNGSFYTLQRVLKRNQF